jgi:hypothetical protein
MAAVSFAAPFLLASALLLRACERNYGSTSADARRIDAEPA